MKTIIIFILIICLCLALYSYVFTDGAAFSFKSLTTDFLAFLNRLTTDIYNFFGFCGHLLNDECPQDCICNCSSCK